MKMNALIWPLPAVTVTEPHCACMAPRAFTYSSAATFAIMERETIKRERRMFHHFNEGRDTWHSLHFEEIIYSLNHFPF